MIKSKIKKLLLFFILILYANISVGQQEASGKIEGNLKLDSLWKPKVFLSYVSNFDRMYTMSKEMILAETPITKNGSFSFKLNYLPREDRIYRLHISKKNDPDASLIIGGIDENHFFIVANKNSSINIKNNKSFRDISIKGSSETVYLKKIDELYSYLDSSYYATNSVIKQEFISNAIDEKLRFVADTSKHPLVSLYAIHKSNYEINYKVNQGFYDNYLSKWKNQNSTYFKHFKSKFPSKKNSNFLLFIVLGVSSFFVGVYFSKYLPKQNKKSKKLASLTIQERKIFNLLKAGKSNKEISEEQHIGLSTVKSHVSSIYTKLGIKSRKEIFNLNI